MRPLRAFLGWFADWRNGATVVASVGVAVVAFVLIDASMARNDALEARNRTAAAATRRIDILNDRIEELGADLVESAASNGLRLGVLSEQVAALQEQVRQLGGEPVIVNPPSTTTTTRPGTTTTSSPPSTTTTTTPPPEEPPAGGLCLGPIRIGDCP